MSRNKITVSEWLTAFGQLEAISKEVPEGWKPIAKIAKETGRSRHSAAKRVAELMAQDPPRVAMKKFLVQTRTRGWYPVPHYQVIKCRN